MNEENDSKLLKRVSTLWTTIFISLINARVVFATGGIGTQEVTTATENIKRVIVSIAMPLRRCANICKRCCCCN